MAKNSDAGENESVKDFFTTNRNDLYSYTECRDIGKKFLSDLKQAVIGENLQEIEEPRAKATKYLEETEILQLIEVIEKTNDLYLQSLTYTFCYVRSLKTKLTCIYPKRVVLVYRKMVRAVRKIDICLISAVSFDRTWLPSLSLRDRRNQWNF